MKGSGRAYHGFANVALGPSGRIPGQGGRSYRYTHGWIQVFHARRAGTRARERPVAYASGLACIARTGFRRFCFWRAYRHGLRRAQRGVVLFHRPEQLRAW